MKKVITLLIVTAMILSLFTGCGNSKVESYKSMAQDFIDGNDKAAAIKVLQQGVAETDNAELKAMLDKLSKVDLSSYIGVWAEETLGWEFGGLTLDIGKDGEDMYLSCLLTQGAPASRVAEVYERFAISDIVDSSLEISYDDDSWGNSGKLKITFAENSISCEFSDIVTCDYPVWGFYEGTFTLIRNDNAHELLSYTMEEYNAKYGEVEPVYDMSKASGILASKGMSVEEFRASCQLLHNTSSDDNVITTQELLDYPTQYVGQHFTFGWYYQSKPTLLNMKVSAKGTSTDGYITYSHSPEYSFQEHILLFDMRDDVYSPNISVGDYIYPYMIFNGVQTLNGIDYLCFRLISVDK